MADISLKALTMLPPDTLPPQDASATPASQDLWAGITAGWAGSGVARTQGRRGNGLAINAQKYSSSRTFMWSMLRKETL